MKFKALALVAAGAALAVAAPAAAQSGTYHVGPEAASQTIQSGTTFGPSDYTVGGITCPTCSIPYVPNAYFGAVVDFRQTQGGIYARATGAVTLGALDIGYASSPGFVTQQNGGYTDLIRSGPSVGASVASTITALGGSGVSGNLTVGADVGGYIHAAACAVTCWNTGNDAWRLKLLNYSPLGFDTSGSGSVNILGVPITNLAAAEPLLAYGNNWGTVDFSNGITPLNNLGPYFSGITVTDKMTANLDFANVIGKVNSTALQSSVSLGPLGTIGYSLLSLPVNITASLTETDIASLFVADYGVSFFNPDGSDASVPYLDHGVPFYGHSFSAQDFFNGDLTLGDGAFDLSSLVMHTYTTYGLDMERTGVLDLEVSGALHAGEVNAGLLGNSGYLFNAGPYGYSYNDTFINTDNVTYFSDVSGPAFIPQPAAVPEPGAWTLMLAGFGGLGVMFRARRRTAFA